MRSRVMNKSRGRAAAKSRFRTPSGRSARGRFLVVGGARDVPPMIRRFRPTSRHALPEWCTTVLPILEALCYPPPPSRCRWVRSRSFRGFDASIMALSIEDTSAGSRLRASALEWPIPETGRGSDGRSLARDETRNGRRNSVSLSFLGLMPSPSYGLAIQTVAEVRVAVLSPVVIGR